jgi:hypothetical protein
VSTAQIVDLVLIWTWHSRQSTLLGIRWSNFSRQGEEETTPSRLAPFIFRETMSGTAFFLTRDTRRGAVASFYVYINFSADPRTWTCAYQTASSCSKCPWITSGPSIDAAISRLIGTL